MRRRILIITCEMLPVPGYPVGGGGLRVWSLGKGLESRGHQVIYSLPKVVIKGKKNIPEYLTKYAHSPEKLNDLIIRVAPDIILFEQWGLATYLDETPIPVIIDLHGSLIMENAFREHRSFVSNAAAKIKALKKADLIICAGENQRLYFLPWFMMSGMDPRELRIVNVPVSMSPELPRHRPSDGLTFVYGGILWPWIDPSPSLDILVKNLEESKAGRLKLFVSRPSAVDVLPYDSIRTSKMGDIETSFKNNKHVEFCGLIPHERLIEEYRRAHVALDVYKRNCERELAFTTRTVEYLWCGLPVIYADYAELSSLIKDYRAGWIVDPTDEKRIQKIIQEIIKNPQIIKEYRRNARRLVRDKLTWDKTIDPLDDFCQNPVCRKKGETIFSKISLEFDRLEAETKQKNRQLHEVLRKRILEIEGLKKRTEDVNRRLQKSGEHIEELQGIIKEREAIAEDMNRNLQDSGRHIGELQDQIREREAVNEDLNRRLRESGKHIEELQGIIKERAAMIEDANKRLQESGEHIKELQDIIKERESVIEDANKRLQESGEHIKELQDIIRDRDSRLMKSAQTLSVKEAELGVTKDELLKTRKELELTAGALRNIQSKTLYKVYKFVVRR